MMIDKLGGSGPSPLRRPTESPATARRASTDERPAAGALSDTGRASGAGRPATSLLARAEAAAASTPPVDSQKVADIKLAMSRGEFRVDARAVAQAFLAMETGA